MDASLTQKYRSETTGAHCRPAVLLADPSGRVDDGWIEP